jgi:hypothetical protein
VDLWKRSRGNGCSRNNGGTVEGGVFYAVRDEVVWGAVAGTFSKLALEPRMWGHLEQESNAKQSPASEDRSLWTQKLRNLLCWEPLPGAFSMPSGHGASVSIRTNSPSFYQRIGGCLDLRTLQTVRKETARGIIIRVYNKLSAMFPCVTSAISPSLSLSPSITIYVITKWWACKIRELTPCWLVT